MTHTQHKLAPHTFHQVVGLCPHLDAIGFLGNHGKGCRDEDRKQDVLLVVAKALQVHKAMCEQSGPTAVSDSDTTVNSLAH